MRKKKRGAVLWAQLEDQLRAAMPHLVSFWLEEEDFREVRFKLKVDGTVLAIAKGYDSDGGEVICFGSGYGVVGSMLALDRSLQGGNWRVDKPWDGKRN